jgi:hypothetical protein
VTTVKCAATASAIALNNGNTAFAGEVAQSGLLFAWVEHCRTCQGNTCIEEVCRYKEILENDFDKSQISLTEIRQRTDESVQRQETFIGEFTSTLDKTGKKLTHTWLLYLLVSFIVIFVNTIQPDRLKNMHSRLRGALRQL